MFTHSQTDAADAGRGVRVCVPAGDIGSGFDLDAVRGALRQGVDAIAMQGTSTDPGPFYLGTGSSYIPRSGIVADLKQIVPVALEARTPLLVSVGGAGTDDELDAIVTEFKDWAETSRLSLNLATVRASVAHDQLIAMLDDGTEIVPMPEAARYFDRTLPRAEVMRSDRIVAQIGLEPFLAALRAGADVVIAGRCLDIALFAAVPVLRGIPREVAYLMAKCIECGSLVAVPGSAVTGVVGEAFRGRFTVTPLEPRARCTTRSVMAHILYEESDGDRLNYPGGSVVIDDLELREVTDRSVQVAGARWVDAESYMIKIEGAARIGSRCIALASVRDEKVFLALPSLIEELKAEIAARFRGGDANVVTVGTAAEPEGCCVMIDVVAQDAGAAMDTANFAKGYLLHAGFPGRRTTSGNLAMWFSPNVIPVGDVYEFNIYHLAPTSNAYQLGSLTLERCRAGAWFDWEGA